MSIPNNQGEEPQDRPESFHNEPELWSQTVQQASASVKPEMLSKIMDISKQLEQVSAELAQPVPFAPTTEGFSSPLQWPPIIFWPTSNLSISGIERTQATQFFLSNGQGSGYAANNSVPLVAQKDLILRVYVNVANLPWLPKPTSVTGKVSYAGHPDLSPLNGPIAPASASSIDRGNTNHTLNFRVPASHCTGTVSFTVTVFDPAHPNDTAYSSRPVSFSATFDSVPYPRIHGVLIHYTGRGMDIPAPTGFDLVNTLDWVARVYPITYFNYSPGCDIVEFSGDLTVGGGGGCGTGWNQLFNMLWNMRAASGTNDVFVGLLPTGVPTSGVIGCGGGGVAISYIGSGQVMAQEIGHAFGRAHAPCGNPGGPDPNYPTYDSYPSASIGEFGFDNLNSQVHNPASTYDYMSYCGPVWTSPYTYVGLKNGIVASPAAAHPERAGGHTAVREHLYLNYRLHRDGRVELLPSFHLHGPAPTAEVGEESHVTCDLLDGEGRIVDSHRCRYSDPHQDPEGPYIDFHEVVPWSPEVQSITIRRHGEVSDTIEVEEQEPEVSVRVQAPRERAARPELMRLEWSETQYREAQQPERTVTYLVRYSNDGGQTLRSVAADLTESRHVVNLDLLPGGEQCLFQVVASSGIRTATANTEPFSVPQKSLQAHILSPEAGATFKKGESVVLLGGGFSPDFGTTKFEDVAWTSSLDGAIGVGFQIVTQSLSVGQHKITLDFPDGLGGEASASRFIVVK